jgi:hypothetical protein
MPPYAYAFLCLLRGSMSRRSVPQRAVVDSGNLETGAGSQATALGPLPTREGSRSRLVGRQKSWVAGRFRTNAYPRLLAKRCHPCPGFAPSRPISRRYKAAGYDEARAAEILRTVFGYTCGYAVMDLSSLCIDGDPSAGTANLHTHDNGSTA